MQTKKRIIKNIIVHCSDTYTHTSPEKIKGEGIPPYHYLITAEGEEIKLLPEKKTCKAEINTGLMGIHIAYIGGRNTEGDAADTRTEQQEDTLFYLLVRLSEKYRKAEINGHRDADPEELTCPRFNLKNWLRNYMPEEIKQEQSQKRENQKIAA